MTDDPAPRQHWFRRLSGGAFDFRHLASGYGLRPLVVLVVFGVFASLDGEAFNLLQPLIKHDLGLNFLRFFSITTAVSAAALLLAGPLGYLADRTRRTVLVGIGGVITGISVLLTGLASSATSLGAARALRSGAGDLTRLPLSSMLVDYYPVGQRVRVITLQQVGGTVGAIITLPVIGYIAHTYGWRVAFYAAWVPVVLVALLVGLGLRNPIRGYQERRAMGASEEEAKIPQPAPSWSEAWRLIWSSRVLRLFYFAWVASSCGSAFLTLRSFYFFQVWHQNPSQLAAIGTISNVADLMVLLLGGGVINYVARLHPSRVLHLTGAVSVATSLVSAVFVLAPVLWLSVVASVVFGAAALLVSASSFGLILNVMPARARSTAVAALTYFGIPAVLVPLPVGALADHIGLQATILAGTAFPVIASCFYFFMGRQYELDMRNAEMSAMATQVHERSKREGHAKQLVMRHVDTHYGAVQVLFGVDLDIVGGELLAILGTNGAGKSTLLRTICGVTEASAGSIVADGYDITHLPPSETATRGVVYVQGGRSIFPSLTVRDNLMLGSWLQRDPGERARDLDRVYGYFPVLRERLDQPAGTLSTGEQQMLALSNALLTRPRLLMIDELSLGLAPTVVTRLLEIVRAINEQGTTVVVVEQSVSVALRLCRRAIFMERGRVRFEGSVEQLRERPDLLRAVFLSGTASMEETSVGAVRSAPSRLRGVHVDPDEVVLQLAQVNKRFGGRDALRDIELSIRRGAIHGLIGPNGAGKTTLLDVVSGFTLPDRGTIVFAGIDVTQWSPDRRARQGIARHFRDARLFPTLTVEEVLTIFVEQSEGGPAAVGDPAWGLRAVRRTRSVGESVDGLIDLMHLDRYRDAPVADLSTGIRRLVDLAGAIASSPQLLLLDEPAAGLAEAETRELTPVLRQASTRLGCAMVIVEHDIGLVSGLAAQLTALHLGRIIASGPPEQVLADAGVLSAYVGDAAAVAQP